MTTTPPPPDPVPGTILVAEDDVPLLRMASQILQRAGWSVVQAQSAEEALAVARTCPDLVLLFTDVVMPGRSGLELAALLTAERPGLPVLVTTGQWDNEIRRALERFDHDVLRKPYTATSLCEAVRARLDGPTDTRGPRT